MTDTEKTVLEKLYDELCVELSTTQLNCDMWHDRAEDMRNRLSAAQAENAKLKEERDHWRVEQVHAYGNWEDAHKRATELEAENAKMRDERERLFRANVERNGEILRLLDENARLKQELEVVGTAAYLYGRTNLADENARLREVVADGELNAREILAENKQLCNENTKLRKLVDYMTPIALYSASEREREEMRELGIEVDG